LRIDGIDVIVEGRGAKSILMIHGYPDTHRLWDSQVAALSERFRCIRFTLPGFDRSPGKRAHSLDEVIELIRRIVERACAGERVVLLMHDWGCLFGYQFASRYPDLVERVIGVDVGDAGSRHNLAELGAKGQLLVLAYQLWLAAAWRIGGFVGDLMARGMARLLRCPTDPRTIHSRMGYPYALRWFGVAGGLKNLKTFEPRTPMLFIYGERKPFMFHSQAWAERLAARPQSRVIGLPTGHWVMIGREREFNDAVAEWLRDSQL
jgi:cis-3-alkyl-4-acyloxetan-2-one decarboxylase